MNNKYDIYQPDSGHFNRFKERLEEHQRYKNSSQQRKYKWYLMAAGIALLISLWFNFKVQDKSSYELADVSEQMKDTQTFFSNTIHTEIKRINTFKSKNNQSIIDDALRQVELLEDEYQNLGKELKTTGFDKRIINAMIFNYQKRIEILQNLLEELESIKTTKNENTTHETV